MIDLYYWPTPNGWKVTIMLEECGIPYRIIPVDITVGEQHSQEFRTLNPNRRMPVLVDHQPEDGAAPITVFESGAILLYLAAKERRLYPADERGRLQVLQWLMWQMSGLGPMIGQNGHFLLYAPEKLPYAIDRFGQEALRLYNVLDAQLEATGRYIAGDYSIADIAVFPWIMTHKAQRITLTDFPNVARWFSELRERPALQRGLAVKRELRVAQLDDRARTALFAQSDK